VAIVVVVVLGSVFGYWLSLRPSNDRDWAPDHAVLASARIDGGSVHVRNIRNFRYPDSGDPTPGYYDRTFLLDDLESLWLILTPFRTDRRGMAHLFLSFGFASGEFVAISVEGRREAGERYSSSKGLLRGYELIYVVADERDVIQRRANKAGKDVYLYPLRASLEPMKRLFIEMLERANQLAAQPEFYNTLTASCSVTVLRHANSVAAREIPFGLRVLLPGYADGLAHELGLLDTAVDLEQARLRFMVSERSRRFADSVDYSQRIRELP
jgi:hypothetical protein